MIFPRISQAIPRSFMNAGRQHARQILLAQSDRSLSDNGFSRALLEQGVDAWPWTEETPSFQPENFAEAKEVKLEEQERERPFDEAMNELNRYSDAELFDLGISRTEVSEAVAQGRGGEEGAGGSREAA